MGKEKELSEENKWKAVINCDNAYERVFYYGVKTDIKSVKKLDRLNRL